MEHKHYRIQPELIRRLGKIITQYKELDLEEDEKYDDTLNICILQCLLSYCVETLRDTNISDNDKQGLSEAVNDLYENDIKQCIKSNFSEIPNKTGLDVFVSIRDALSHPHDIGNDYELENTGYSSPPSISGKIEKYIFVHFQNKRKRGTFRIELTVSEIKKIVDKLISCFNNDV